MCNPRKVMIHLAKRIEEAWRQTVQQTATVSGEVSELGRITADVRMDEEMGETALNMLERVLSGEFQGFEPWERDSVGQYRREMDAVTLIYNPHTHQLHIESRLTELLSADAQAAAEASGFTVGEVAVEAIGNYYSDGWGGRTESRALQEAQQLAEHRMTQAIANLHHQQHAEKLKTASRQAQAEAERRARQELIQRQTETRQAMRQQLQMTLAQAEDRVYYVMNRAVGEAYRQTLRQLVLQNGGRILADEQTGSVINMELEVY